MSAKLPMLELAAALAALKDADGEVRAAEQAKRDAERARDVQRKAVGRALATLRLALGVPASQAVRRASLSMPVERYVELEDGQSWDESTVRQAADSLTREARTKYADDDEEAPADA